MELFEVNKVIIDDDARNEIANYLDKNPKCITEQDVRKVFKEAISGGYINMGRYVNEEVKIGKWITGEDIFRQVYHLDVVGTGVTSIDSQIEISNLIHTTGSARTALGNLITIPWAGDKDGFADVYYTQDNHLALTTNIELSDVDIVVEYIMP